MSTAAVSSDSLYQQLQSFYQQRQSDVQQLGQALQSGNLAGAQQAFNAIQTLGQSGPFASGDPFRNSTRESDFSAIGQALQSGDLAGAQTAFAAFQSTFHNQTQATPSDSTGPSVVVNLGSTSTAAASATTPSAATTGPEIVINLPANTGAGEQLTIGVNNTGSGTDQLTISLGTQQNPSSQDQITLNLNANSNEQIVLNLLNSQASTPSPNSSGLSVVA